MVHNHMCKLNNIHLKYNKNSANILKEYVWKCPDSNFIIISESYIHTYTIDDHYPQ